MRIVDDAWENRHEIADWIMKQGPDRTHAVLTAILAFDTTLTEALYRDWKESQHDESTRD